MHRRRWNWLSKEMTTSLGRSLMSVAFRRRPAGANFNQDYGSGVIAACCLTVCASSLTTTSATTASANQDEIYVVPLAKCHLYEDANAPAYHPVRTAKRGESRRFVCGLRLLRFHLRSLWRWKYAKGIGHGPHYADVLSRYRRYTRQARQDGRTDVFSVLGYDGIPEPPQTVSARSRRYRCKTA